MSDDPFADVRAGLDDALKPRAPSKGEWIAFVVVVLVIIGIGFALGRASVRKVAKAAGEAAAGG